MRRREFLGFIGGAAAWPLSARAQQRGVPIVGFLHFGSPRMFEYQVAAFNKGLKDTDYVDGRNVAIEYRWAEGHYDRLPALAADLVDHRADVITAIGPTCARAAKNATSTIPIVFTTAPRPIRRYLNDTGKSLFA